MPATVPTPPEQPRMITLEPGLTSQLSPRVRRIIAPNPGVMTGPGTNTYLLGNDAIAVVDPGPDEPSHIDAILREGAGRIRWILVTHTHEDHSPAATPLARATGAELRGVANVSKVIVGAVLSTCHDVDASAAITLPAASWMPEPAAFSRRA